MTLTPMIISLLPALLFAIGGWIYLLREQWRKSSPEALDASFVEWLLRPLPAPCETLGHEYLLDPQICFWCGQEPSQRLKAVCGASGRWFLSMGRHARTYWINPDPSINDLGDGWIEVPNRLHVHGTSFLATVESFCEPIQEKAPAQISQPYSRSVASSPWGDSRTPSFSSPPPKARSDSRASRELTTRFNGRSDYLGSPYSGDAPLQPERAALPVAYTDKQLKEIKDMLMKEHFERVYD